jgi:hypothetical protein
VVTASGAFPVNAGGNGNGLAYLGISFITAVSMAIIQILEN